MKENVRHRNGEDILKITLHGLNVAEVDVRG